MIIPSQWVKLGVCLAASVALLCNCGGLCSWAQTAPDFPGKPESEGYSSKKLEALRAWPQARRRR